MPTFNIAEAKAHFSQLVQKAMLGEKIIIAIVRTPFSCVVTTNFDTLLEDAYSRRFSVGDRRR